MTTKDKPEVRMLLTVDRPRNQYADPNVIDATAIFVRIELEDGREHVRNISTSSFMRPENLPELADLQVRAWGYLNEDDRELYMSEVQYRDVFSVDLERAKLMAKTLGRVTRQLQQLERELGFAEDYAAYVARVGKILGVKQYGWRVGERDHGWYDENDYQWRDASYLKDYVTGRLRVLREGRVTS